MHIEQPIGILKQRWVITWKSLGFAIEENCRIVCPTMLLRNYSIDEISELQESDENDNGEEMQRARDSLKQ